MKGKTSETSCFFVFAAIVLLCISFGYGCSQDVSSDDRFTGSWRMKKGKEHKILIFRANGTWQSQVRKEGRLGKVVTKDAQTLEQLKTDGYVAFRYVDADGNQGPFPINPNGAMDSIAGLTDSTGRVLGLMPHPERFIQRTQHPHWTRLQNGDPDGMTIFDNAVRYVRENL